MYFFCNFQEREQQSIPKVLAAVARQLVEQRTSLLPDVKRYLDSDTSSQLPGLSLQNEQRKLFDLLITLCSNFTKVYIVLDAVDEFSSHLEV